MSSRLKPAARMKARGAEPRRFKRTAATMSAMESGAQRRHVVVLGGGIQGASAAYFLSKRDAKVTVVELESVGSAASGKVSCSRPRQQNILSTKTASSAILTSRSAPQKLCIPPCILCILSSLGWRFFGGRVGLGSHHSAAQGVLSDA